PTPCALPPLPPPLGAITRTGSDGRCATRPLSARSVRAPAEKERTPQVAPPTFRTRDMAPLRALVCDDYSMVCETIRPLLLDAGIETGREATLATEDLPLCGMRD